MTTFIRVLNESVDEKPVALLRAISKLGEGAPEPPLGVFDFAPESFSSVPGTPFSYWVSDDIRSLFTSNADMTGIGGVTKCGLGTLDDFRFLRLWWETSSKKWVAFPKGGTYSRWYSAVPLTLDWVNDGVELKTFVEAKVGSASRKIQAQDYYFRPGLTWPRRTQGGFGIRAMPQNCIFADKGPAAFVQGDSPESLLALLAITTSAPFLYLVQLQMAFGSYEVGVIQRTPLAKMSGAEAAHLAGLARRAWSLKRALDTSNEPSHAFTLPPGLNERAAGWQPEAIERELAAIQGQLDETALALYAIGANDRAAITATEKSVAETEPSNLDDEADLAGGSEDGSLSGSAEALPSWLVGVAFARFDPRLATGERAIPPEPEPFDPLPARSPAMFPEGDEPADRPSILVDDEGHADDLATRALAVADRVKVGATENLRGWLAREFFQLHIKVYSNSRRKAPIYWQLATASARYSVWLYIHAFRKDTLHRVLDNYVQPKLQHEERRLDTLRAEVGYSPTNAQRRELEPAEAFVDELRAFRDEVARVTPLWDPDLDDGVILNAAPLWRLFAHAPSWARECKAKWDELVDGDYDWSHIAMRLWPERVVPKCADDRSLAIAHGLEATFWVEGDNGKWAKRTVDDATVQRLINERTRPAVKAALQSLLDTGEAGASRGRARPARAPRTSRAQAEPAAPTVDAATLHTRGGHDEVVLQQIVDAMRAKPGGASKADVLAVVPLSDGQWNAAVQKLIDDGQVERTGNKRAARYTLRTGRLL
jgi:hypothetical protein